jgi:dCTP deaminase
MSRPWEKWIPGVLNDRQFGELIKDGMIASNGHLKAEEIESAIDLNLSDECYEMPLGSVKPMGARYKAFVTSQKYAIRMERTKEYYELKPKHTYLFQLQEYLGQRLAEGRIHGMATAKSSVGRVDVLARLIVDGMDRYECFDPDGLSNGNGEVYLEVTPMTFPVFARPGESLSQLRLFYGSPEDALVTNSRELHRTILHGSSASDGSLSVDLTPDTVGGLCVAAFCADDRDGQCNPVPLWKETNHANIPRPEKYWRFVQPSLLGDKRIKIQKTDFYLLRSKELISVHPDIAVYCRASDETIGEMRIHYAGFAHPYFGWERDDGLEGTPLIFEVRGHDVDVSLADGEKMARLSFFRMSEGVKEPKDRYYNKQCLQLSGFFGAWPPKLRLVDDNGRVEPIQG